MKTAIWVLCCLAVLGHGCGRKSGESQTAAQPGAAQAPTGPPNAAIVNSATSPASTPATNIVGLNACSLIKESEIAEVQGAKVHSVVQNAESNGDLVVSQCYFTINSAGGSKNLSVHLQVTQADPKGSNPNAVKDYWAKSFRPQKGKQPGQNKKGTEGESVAGIGEEAFWEGNNMMGVLYALKKDKLIRLSLGGPDDPKARLDKSKKLVAKALERLS